MRAGKLCVVLTLFVGGCSSGTGPPKSAAAPLATNNDVDCSQHPPVFPTFDQSCQAASDCVMVLHQIDCCGTQHALGIHPADRGRFDADEAICTSFGPRGYPACGCAGQGILADIGP